MKRSKMLEELAFYYETDEFDSPHDAKINAERVLNLIEHFGMMPPTIISMPTHYNRTEGTYGWEVNKWEAETEETKK